MKQAPNQTVRVGGKFQYVSFSHAQPCEWCIHSTTATSTTGNSASDFPSGRASIDGRHRFLHPFLIHVHQVWALFPLEHAHSHVWTGQPPLDCATPHPCPSFTNATRHPLSNRHDTHPSAMLRRLSPTRGSFSGETEEDHAKRKFWERVWQCSEWVEQDTLHKAESAVAPPRRPPLPCPHDWSHLGWKRHHTHKGLQICGLLSH